MRTHLFYPSPHATHDGKRICDLCGCTESAKVHDVPAVPVEAREIDARRVGETL